MKRVYVGQVIQFTYKTPVAKRVGKVIRVETQGQNFAYRNTILVDHGNAIFRRYHAHLVSGVKTVPLYVRVWNYVSGKVVYGKHAFVGV